MADQRPGSSEHRCSQCNQTFSSSEELRKHNETQHQQKGQSQGVGQERSQGAGQERVRERARKRAPTLARAGNLARAGRAMLGPPLDLARYLSSEIADIISGRQMARDAARRSRSRGPLKGGPMRLVLLVVLLLLLVGALPAWPYSQGWGYYPSGRIGLLLLSSWFLCYLAAAGQSRSFGGPYG